MDCQIPEDSEDGLKRTVWSFKTEALAGRFEIRLTEVVHKERDKPKGRFRKVGHYNAWVHPKRLAPEEVPPEVQARARAALISLFRHAIADADVVARW